MTGEQSSTAFPVPAPRGACPFDPPPRYVHALRSAPVTRVRLWDGTSCWLVTGHKEVREVLRDRRFSADRTRPGFPFLSRSRAALADPSFLWTDDPRHARLRRMVTADFTYRRAESMRPWIQELTDTLLDRMTQQAQPADLVTALALPLSLRVICRLLGVPHDDHALITEHSGTLFDTRSTPETVRETEEKLLAHLTALVEGKRAAGDGGILGRLVAAGDLSPAEIASMGRLLLVTGHEPSTHMITLSVLALLLHPEQLGRLRADPSTVPQAVEELLRYLTVLHGGVPRTATVDIVVGEELITAGEGVLCMLNTANRDETVFPAADTLDTDRDARAHIAFGYGTHACLGRYLARVELDVVLRTLLHRLPRLRLAGPAEDLRFREEMAVYGAHRLPIAW